MPHMRVHTNINTMDSKDFESFESISSSDVNSTTEIKNVIDSEIFNQGIGTELHLTGGLRNAIERGFQETFNYISKHTNPNQYTGMLKNLVNVFTTGALNQNCIYCSKAVDKNLASVSSGVVDDFWVATSTASGSLPDNVSGENYRQFLLQDGQHLSEQLLQQTEDGKRYILTVPVRGKEYAHAMNLVSTSIGNIVIDGQFGLTYNLNSQKERDNFDKYYGGHGRVCMYTTGDAPKVKEIDDEQLVNSFVFLDLV